MGDAVGDRAQDPSAPPYAPAAHDDQVGADRIVHPDDDIGRVSRLGVDLDVETLGSSATLSSMPWASLTNSRPPDGSETSAPPAGTATAAGE